MSEKGIYSERSRIYRSMEIVRISLSGQNDLIVVVGINTSFSVTEWPNEHELTYLYRGGQKHNCHERREEIFLFSQIYCELKSFTVKMTVP